MDRPWPIDPNMYWNRTAGAVQRNSGRVDRNRQGAQGRVALRSPRHARDPVFPRLPLGTPGIQIASQARIGIYDCLDVALAERDGCDVLTADSRLVNSVPQIA